ncbi:DEKNAAC102990 [Brettanomyces naardenensis]|uniref:N(6)-L-threonylcarbamoyladenine synthase n=1 Tax=Brettanomyces naardenensis TaxID=13370 RepID=A0A448YM69_BRENA|nr:DEKNAAC102990 [Brettanomyces naardenensis]
MLVRSLVVRSRCPSVLTCTYSRSYRVLAIESSCDDSCVTLLDRYSPREPPRVVDELKRTLDSVDSGGVVPADAARHNSKNISVLANEALTRNGWNTPATKPDLVSATRGPGMMGSLAAGYQLALGLSVAWQVPIVGVNHMLGHLLMARMATNGKQPTFPFLSLLVSGGHTICVLSHSVTEHEILVDTIDIAAGDALDKCGRELGIKGNMIGKEMDKFLGLHREEWGQPTKLELREPMQNESHRKDVLSYSFSSFISQLRRSVVRNYGGIIPPDDKTRARMGYQIQAAIFQHMITKIKLAIHKRGLFIDEFVCAGGVASNGTLRAMLKEQLKPLGVTKFYFPDPNHCTDNATMIGWAGIELYEKGYTTDLCTTIIRKWPIDELLNLYGWHKLE